MAPGVVVIGSLPESNVEAGGERACRRFSDSRRYSPRAFQLAARGGDAACFSRWTPTARESPTRR